MRKSLVAATAVALVLAATSAANAWRTVYDPWNHVQNIRTAIRSLEQIRHQLTSLQNEAQMLINQGRNLASLPYSSLQQLQTTFDETRQLLADAQRLAYDVADIDQMFDQSYGPANLNATDQALVDGARERWQTAVASFQDSLRVQAGVVQNMEATQTELSALVTESQRAEGALQAAQAGNQLLAVQSQQIADLTAVLVAQGRADTLGSAAQTAAQEQAREQLSRFLAPGTGYQPSTVRMFGN